MHFKWHFQHILNSWPAKTQDFSLEPDLVTLSTRLGRVPTADAKHNTFKSFKPQLTLCHCFQFPWNDWGSTMSACTRGSSWTLAVWRLGCYFAPNKKILVDVLHEDLLFFVWFVCTCTVLLTLWLSRVVVASDGLCICHQGYFSKLRCSTTWSQQLVESAGQKLKTLK